MKPGTFALNPYAASYVPLSKREGSVRDEEPLWSTPLAHLSQNQHCVPSLDSAGQGIKKISSPEVFTGKTPSVQDPRGSFSQNPGGMTYQQTSDEDLEMDMDIEYLQMTFPGLSRESIADVYLVNNGDLEATIDMLNQLEMYGAESQENLPETLDIGDVSESWPSSSSTSKQKNAATEAPASSSASPNTAVSS